MIRSIVNEANGPVALRVLTASRNPDSMLTSSLRGGWYWRVAKKATTTIPIEAPFPRREKQVPEAVGEDRRRGRFSNCRMFLDQTVLGNKCAKVRILLSLVEARRGPVRQ
jgi:hypothetical protein